MIATEIVQAIDLNQENIRIDNDEKAASIWDHNIFTIKNIIILGHELKIIYLYIYNS